jgi:hypothetical protein
MKIKIYRTILLPVVFYVCETWSLTLKEERRLWVFENRVLRRIFGSKRDEVTGECRKLHMGEISDLYSSQNIVRVIKSRRKRCLEYVAQMGARRVAYRILVVSLKHGDQLKDRGVDGSKTLRWTSCFLHREL